MDVSEGIIEKQHFETPKEQPLQLFKTSKSTSFSNNVSGFSVFKRTAKKRATSSMNIISKPSITINGTLEGNNNENNDILT